MSLRSRDRVNVIVVVSVRCEHSICLVVSAVVWLSW